MVIGAYWWRPFWPVGTAVKESVKHGGAWFNARRLGRTLSNFGDEINPHVLRELTGHEITWAPLGREEVVGVGSVLDAYCRDGGRGLIGGVGFRTAGNRVLPEERVLGVRGTLSAAAAGLEASAAIGDPGLVFAAMAVAGRRPFTSRRVVVPHFASMTASGMRELRALQSQGFRVVAPTVNPWEMAWEISRAEYVLTSSLHAIVFADGLGVPVQRVTFENDVPEPDFKYQDYRSIFGLTSGSVACGAIAAGMSDQVRERMISEQEVIRSKMGNVVSGIYASYQGHF